eukprot:1192353-Prorocentrum_minimum.AAC.3
MSRGTSRVCHTKLRIRPWYQTGRDTHGARLLGCPDLAVVGDQRLESEPVQPPRPTHQHRFS